MTEELSFGLFHTMPIMLQTEATECGLACLGMIAGYYGLRTDLGTLRARYPTSMRGTTLTELIRIADEIALSTRPLSVTLPELKQVKLPCVLHWEFRHFVVLQRLTAKYAVICDPAVGRRKLPMTEISNSFTGVVLEVWPAQNFRPREERQSISWRALFGSNRGIGKLFGQIILLALALELCALIFPFFTQWVIDEVIVTNDRDLLTTLVWGFGLLLVFQQGVAALRGWVIMYMDNSVGVQWRGNVFAHLMKLPPSYFFRRHLGDILSRFGAVDQIQKTVTTSFVAAILDGLMSIVTLIMMFVYSWRLSLIAIGAIALYSLLRWARYSALRGATEGQIAAAARQQSHFLESIRGAKTIKLFQRESDRRSYWLGLVVRQANATIRTQKAQLLFESVRGTLSGIEKLWVIWLGARMVMNGNFTTGALMAYLAYKEQFDTRMTSLIDKLVDVKMLQLQMHRLSDIVLTAPERPSVTMLEGLRAHAHDIELRAVWYRFAESEPYVIRDVTLKIAAGESIVITGPSGGGKTTVVNLLLGLLAPTSGSVLLGGHDLARVGPAAMRSLCGTVMQDDVLFAGSIAENICFFESSPDFERIQDCARLAMIHEDIQSMAMKYRTLIGDMGAILSGGQKQRVLLARALYRNPKILIMDEATSYLDRALELQFVAALRSLSITRIMVAHRRETIEAADRVIVLSNGSIAQDSLRPNASDCLKA